LELQPVVPGIRIGDEEVSLRPVAIEARLAAEPALRSLRIERRRAEIRAEAVAARVNGRRAEWNRGIQLGAAIEIEAASADVRDRRRHAPRQLALDREIRLHAVRLLQMKIDAAGRAAARPF